MQRIKKEKEKEKKKAMTIVNLKQYVRSQVKSRDRVHRELKKHGFADWRVKGKHSGFRNKQSPSKANNCSVQNRLGTQRTGALTSEKQEEKSNQKTPENAEYIYS